MIMKKKKPSFKVLNEGSRKRVKSSWRKPRGTHNKKRMKMKWTGASPSIGYKNPEAVRGLHPNGNKETIIHNVSELEGISGVVRIAAAVGARKKKEIAEHAKKLKLKVLNLGGKKPEFKPKGAKS
jgi:large subunit ribosomal protein L32e